MDFPKCFDLKEKTIVITGGAGVLCSNIAKAIGECGGKVAILDIDKEAMKELSKDLNEKNIENITLKADVLDKKSLKKAKENIIEEFDTIDVLINGAGGNKPGATTDNENTFFDLPIKEVKKTFDLNFIGTFIPSQIFGEVLAEKGEGVILNVSSMNAFTPLTKIPAYSAAKAAVSNFTRWLAVHMSHNYSENIRVNAIAPGFFLTKQTRYLHMDPETGELTQRGKKIINHTPMDRFGDPKDLITAVLWLITPGSEFVHGSVIPIDGGFSSYSGV